MEEIVDMFVNSGSAIACLIYFMWYNNATMKEFTNTMNKMNDNIITLIENLKKDNKDL